MFHRSSFLVQHFALLLALLPGCAAPSPTPPGNFIIFHDRTHPQYEWLIIVGPEETFLQKHDFPGYTNRQCFILPENHSAHPACTLPGNLTPPFPPSGPDLIRTTLTPTGGIPDGSFFSNDTPALRQFLTTLQSSPTKKPIPHPPTWITTHEFLLPILGG